MGFIIFIFLVFVLQYLFSRSKISWLGWLLPMFNFIFATMTVLFMYNYRTGELPHWGNTLYFYFVLNITTVLLLVMRFIVVKYSRGKEELDNIKSL